MKLKEIQEDLEAQENNLESLYDPEIEKANNLLFKKLEDLGYVFLDFSEYENTINLVKPL